MDQTTPPRLAQEPLSDSEIRTVVVGILLAMLLAALDQTIIATALPTIGRELGDVAHLPWVVTVYLLTSTAVTPLYGKFADSHGRRITMLVGIAVFIVGSVACALAPTMLVLILARGLQGLGGGGLIALAQTIIGDLVPPQLRASRSETVAATRSAAPRTSISWGRSKRGSFLRVRFEMASAASPSGRLIQKITDQCRCSAKNPPSTGPRRLEVMNTLAK